MTLASVAIAQSKTGQRRLSARAAHSKQDMVRGMMRNGKNFVARLQQPGRRRHAASMNTVEFEKPDDLLVYKAILEHYQGESQSEHETEKHPG